jgi:hypothetical protein
MSKNGSSQGVAVSQQPKYSFARHETFHPRFGWIKKGFDAVSNDPAIFSREDAHIHLGVGKNMATAIRYWCSAFKVIRAEEAAAGRARNYVPTEFGQQLLAAEGWDSYLEDSASLWLLHWYLLKSPSEATTWKFVFDIYRKTEFTTEDILTELGAFRDRLGLKVLDSSLSKDVSCLLRMYVAQDRKKQLTEETLDCPFVELGLMQRAGDTRHLAFRTGAKPNLPPAVIVAAALDFVAARDANQRTISIASLTYESGSPGFAFKLTESAICQAIEAIRPKQSVWLADAAGLVQMSFEGNPARLAQRILRHYYNR